MSLPGIQWWWWGGPLNPFWCVFSRVGRVNQLNKIRSFFSIFWRLLGYFFWPIPNGSWITILWIQGVPSSCCHLARTPPSLPSLDNNSPPRPSSSPEPEIPIERPKNGFNCWNFVFRPEIINWNFNRFHEGLLCICVGSPDCLACLITILTRCWWTDSPVIAKAVLWWILKH